MKCEICHKADATQAMVREGAGEDDELYVCAACAKAAQEKRQRKRMSITMVSGGDEPPPPIIGAIMDAFEGLAREISGAGDEAGEDAPKIEKKIIRAKAYKEFPTSRVLTDYRVHGAIHLEGLYLIGEIDAVKRALHALGMKLEGFAADGVADAGHVYRVLYSGAIDRAKHVVEDLLREEKNARIRLREENPRVFADAMSRALAMLRNCRLLSSGELFDLLSPLRLALKERLVKGITLSEVESMMNELDLANTEDAITQEERDQADAERADEVNHRFEEVFIHDIL